MAAGEPCEARKCPRCGYVASNDDIAHDAFFRPWHVVHGRQAVRSYVKSLGEEAHEWLLALYVDSHMQLLAVETVARGDISSCVLPTWKLIDRAHQLKAEGFILVHNHPSGDPRASRSDILATRRLADISRELNVPLLDHLIIAGDKMGEVGEWGFGGTDLDETNGPLWF